MAKNIITHNPFEDMPDFRKKVDEKKEIELSIKGAYIEGLSKDTIDKIDYDVGKKLAIWLSVFLLFDGILTE
jgi:hypothetical protein